MNQSESNVIIDQIQAKDLVYYINKREELFYNLKYISNITKEDNSEVSFCGYRLKFDDEETDDEETFEYIKNFFVKHYEKQFDMINEKLLEFGIVVE